jgi:hypothetical protein
MKKFAYIIAAVSVAVTALSAGSQVGARENRNATGTSTLKICERPDGTLPTVVDLLLLFDNSRSLNSIKVPPTDKTGQRFVAVSKMLSAIGSAVEGSDAIVNFGLIKFGRNATVLIPFGEKTISRSSANDLSKEIKQLLPPKPESQELDTNYIKALDSAQQMFEAQSSTHCRVMVWFTDGEFNLEIADKSKVAEKLESLKTKTCASEGWPQSFRKLNVNVFAVLLAGKEKKRNKSEQNAYEASLNLMQTLTGDPDPEFPTGISSVEGCGEKISHNGEVLSSENAASLGGLFEEIGLRVGGGVVLVCPNDGSPIQTGSLPDTRFLDWIVLFSREGRSLPKISDIKVDRSGSSSSSGDPIDGLLEVDSRLSTPGRLQLVPSATNPLSAGWTLRISEDTKGLCVMARLINPLTVRLSRVGDSPVKIEEMKTSLLSVEELNSLVYEIDGKVASATEVGNAQLEGLKSGSLPTFSASLVVDQTNLVFPMQLKVNVAFDELIPDVRDCKNFSFDSPRLSGDMPREQDNRLFRSISCEISTKGTQSSIQIDGDSFQQSLGSTKGCEDITGKLLVDGKEVSANTYVLPPNSAANVSLSAELRGKSSKCILQSDEAVAFTFQLKDGSSKTVTVNASLKSDLRPIPDERWVLFLTVLFVVLAGLLSLLLLQTMNRFFGKLPKAQNLYFYESEIQITSGQYQQVAAVIDGKSLNDFEVLARDLKPVPSTSSSSKMQLGKNSLQRNLPSFLKPFREATATVVGEESAVYWQQSSRLGLVVPFRSAMILRKSQNQNSAKGVVNATIIVLVPRNGRDSGVEGVKNLLKGSKFQDLARMLQDQITERDDSKLSKESSTASGPGSPPPPPPPPVPK